LFEAADGVALQAQTKRDHRDDDGDADQHAHRRQNGTQLCLAQVAKRQAKNVMERHSEKQKTEVRSQESEGRGSRTTVTDFLFS
jgi:hypothetical protein